MANPFYESMQKKQVPPVNNMSLFFQNLQQLKARGGDPNQMIQQLLNSGKVSQEQYNAAVEKAKTLQQMFGN